MLTPAARVLAARVLVAPAGLAVPVVQVLVALAVPVVLARVALAIPAMVTADTAQGVTNLAALAVTAVTGPAAPVSPAVQDQADRANQVVLAGMIRVDLADTTRVVRVRKAQVQRGRVAQVLRPGRVLPGLMPTDPVPMQADLDLMPAEPGRTYPADRVQIPPVDRRWDPTARAEAICPAAVTCPVEGTLRGEATPAAVATPAVVADP